MVLKGLSRGFLKLIGWTYEPLPNYWQDKQVVIGFPHTTNMDGARSVAWFLALGQRTHALMKVELFKGPMAPLLRALGCIPVVRGRSSNAVQNIADEFAKHEDFTLMISPEGTRTKVGQPTKPIKTGFWHIANQAGVPIVMMYSDSQAKHGSFLGQVTPSGNMAADLLRVKEAYGKVGVKVVLPDLVESGANAA